MELLLTFVVGLLVIFFFSLLVAVSDKNSFGKSLRFAVILTGIIAAFVTGFAIVISL
jgi:hypothetical protein